MLYYYFVVIFSIVVGRTNSIHNDSSYKTTNVEAMVYVFGGCSNGITNTLNIYDLEQKHWRTRLCMPRHRSRHAMTVVDQKVFLLSGVDSWWYMQPAEYFDVNSTNWTSIAPIPMNEEMSSAASIGEKVYACGSSNCNVYNIKTNDWSNISRFSGVRSQFQMATSKSQLYVIGGKALEAGKWKTSREVKKYNQDKDSWSSVAPMNQARAYHSVAVLNDLIYVAGGLYRLESPGWYRDPLKSVEVFDSVKDEWKLLAPMQQKRHHFGLVSARGKLMALGGWGDKPSCSMEIYDTISNVWTFLPDEMPECKSHFTSIAI